MATVTNKQLRDIMTDVGGQVITLSAKVDDVITEQAKVRAEVDKQTALANQVHVSLTNQAALAQGTANRALTAIDGNGKPGLKLDIANLDNKIVTHMETVSGRFDVVGEKIGWVYRGLGAIGLLLAGILVTLIVDTYKTPSANVTQEYRVVVVTATPSLSSYIPTPTPTPHPTPRQRPLYEPTDEDLDALARLCTIETRDMLGVRDDACLSVVGTVMTRIYSGKMSDGTIQGTIARGCGPDTVECNFPAHVVWGCDGIQTRACAYTYPRDIEHFTYIVAKYFEGARGSCDGRLFYGIKAFDMSDCVIQAANGLWQGYHD